MMVVNDLMRADRLAGIFGVVFDCDGVLVDSLEANKFYYNWFRERFGLPPMNAEEERYTHIQNVYNSLKRIVPEGRLDEAMALREEFDYRLVLPHIHPEPGIFDLLILLRAMGVRMAVNTSRTNTTELLLDHLGMNGFFQPVVSTAQVSRPKPHPEGVHLILDAWGLRTEDVAFIGDSSVDQGTAENAGVEFWAYRNPRLEAALHVPDFPSLTRAFARSRGLGF